MQNVFHSRERKHVDTIQLPSFQAVFGDKKPKKIVELKRTFRNDSDYEVKKEMFFNYDHISEE